MISHAALVDLQGPKVLAQYAFVTSNLDRERMDAALEIFYDSLISEEKRELVLVGAEPPTECVLRLNETSVLVVIADQEGLDPRDLNGIRALGKAIEWLAGGETIRAVKDDFPDLVRRHLMRRVTFVVVTSDTITGQNLPGRAVLKMVGDIGGRTEEPYEVGPYLVSIVHQTYSCLGLFLDVEDLSGCAFVTAPDVEFSEYDAVVTNARRRGNVTVMVIPGSDDQLEHARELEEMLGVVLCDSVSDSPTELVLSLLCTATLADMHPELARRVWKIDERLERPAEHEQLSGGHRAFFVINRNTGEPVFAYYYDNSPSLVARAPNVIAAVASFALGDRSSEKTAVIRLGDMNYVTIEHGTLVFTLVTGQDHGLEELRDRFTALPELWEAENVEQGRTVGADPYDAIPFTLKILSLLPPEDLLPRTVPVRIRDPDWDRFSSQLVRDFLRTLWESIDGEIDVGQLAYGAGLRLAIGGIHLLRRIGAIDFRLRVRESDIPVLVGSVPPDMESAYQELGSILREVDGSRTVGEIARSVGISLDVLSTLMVRLYERGVIDFEFELGPTQKPS